MKARRMASRRHRIARIRRRCVQHYHLPMKQSNTEVETSDVQ